MDYKNNLKYFGKSKLTTFIFVALGLVLVGFILLFLFESQAAFLIAAGIGAVVFIVGYSMEVKDADIDDCSIPIEREFRDAFHAKFLERPIDKLKMLSAEYQKRKDPEYWGVFYMENDDVSGKHGRDGTFRTSEYCVCGIWLEKEQVNVGMRVVSLLEEKQYEDMRTFKYDEMAPIEYVSPKYPDMARYRVLAFKKLNGDDVMRVPVHDDAHMEDLVERMNKDIARIQGKLPE